MKNLTHYLSGLAVLISIVSLGLSLERNGYLGSTITTTNSSDTLETFRTNVNASLTSLQNDKVSTTTAYTWTAAQKFMAGASTTELSSNFFEVGQTATTTLTATGRIGLASTTPWALLSVNPNVITGPAFSIGSTTSTYFVVSNGGYVGISSSSPSTALSLGTTGATTTVSGGYFCQYFKDETGRGMFIKLAISGNTVFSTSTASCK